MIPWIYQSFLSMNISVNFVSDYQDDESPSEEFDTDSECKETVGDDSDDELTFLRAVTTCSGRAVQVKFFS